MNKELNNILNKPDIYYIKLILEGLLVGVVAGIVVLLYRIALEYANKWLFFVSEIVNNNTTIYVLWIVLLFVIAYIIHKLVQFEPLISGSGIPQLEGEMIGSINQTWYKVLPAKFIGGFLALLGGLSLGREGPSIQLGAMSGKGISKLLKKNKTDEKFLLTCGASAGLAAAFHAPLAGVMFSLEEIHKNFSVSVLISVMTASVTADYLSSQVIGANPVFGFDIGNILPQEYYWMIVILGIILGIMGAFYNFFTLYVQSLYKKIDNKYNYLKILFPFLIAGILIKLWPELLGSGHNIIDEITNHNFTLQVLIVVFVLKLIFSTICFGSGTPGGIFFPMLVLGALLGGIFGMIGVNYFGMDTDYINNFVLLAMAGYFTAIVRAPLTGIILIFEMTGSLNHMLSLTIISVVSYIVATLLKSEPIYESLLERLTKNQKKYGFENNNVFSQHIIMHGSNLENRKVSDIDLPEDCLVISIMRNSKKIIPKGNTILKPGDILIVMTSEDHLSSVNSHMQLICKQKII